LSGAVKVGQLRYVNLGWCKLTEESVPALCSLIKSNASLEKLMIMHNTIVKHDDSGRNIAMRRVIETIEKHPGVRYLDVSGTKLGEENLVYLLDLQAQNIVHLENLQCRKN